MRCCDYWANGVVAEPRGCDGVPRDGDGHGGGARVGPLLTALIVLSWAGTANVVELGTARALGEIEALEVMGIDPIHYLVVPRMIGMGLAVFALTIYLILGALVSGYVWAFLQDVPLTPGEYAATRDVGSVDRFCGAGAEDVPVRHEHRGGDLLPWPGAHAAIGGSLERDGARGGADGGGVHVDRRAFHSYLPGCMSEQGEVTTATPMIEMVDATLTSLADPRRVVAEDVNWAVMPGDYWVVGGLHGVGKSDFIAAAGGILLPTRGIPAFRQRD